MEKECLLEMGGTPFVGNSRSGQAQDAGEGKGWAVGSSRCWLWESKEG